VVEKFWCVVNGTPQLITRDEALFEVSAGRTGPFMRENQVGGWVSAADLGLIPAAAAPSASAATPPPPPPNAAAAPDSSWAPEDEQKFRDLWIAVKDRKDISQLSALTALMNRRPKSLPNPS
jgi:hypothetical protein